VRHYIVYFDCTFLPQCDVTSSVSERHRAPRAVRCAPRNIGSADCCTMLRDA